MPKDFIIEQLKIEFSGKDSFSKDDLFHFYKKFEPDLNESTFRWRIYDLKEKKLIRVVSKSEYSLSYKPIFKPQLDNKAKEIYKLVDKEYPNLRKDIWSTRCLVDLMLHIPGKYWMLVEVEKDSVQSVFSMLKQNNYREVYLQPDEKEMDWYIADSTQSIIVKSIISLAPIQKVKNIHVPTMEKIMVDIFSDKHLFSVFQGSEMSVIFNNAYNNYQVNFSKLMAYAKRRGRERELAEFISLKTEIPNTLFND